MNQRHRWYDRFTEHKVTLYLVDGERPKIWTVSSDYNERMQMWDKGVTELIVSSETQ